MRNRLASSMGYARHCPAMALTVWASEAQRGDWVRFPEARVFPAFFRLVVQVTQPGLYGVFHAADGSLGVAGTTGPVPLPPYAPAQGRGWQDIGVVTTLPSWSPGTRPRCPTGPTSFGSCVPRRMADLAAVQTASTPTIAGGSASGGGGCSLRPGDAWSRATALAAVGNIGLPLVALLVLGLWACRRPL